MAKLPSVKLDSPIGDLEWAFIDGEGRLNDNNGKYEYSIQVVLDPNQVDEKTTEKQASEHKAFQERVAEFWKENKPAEAKGKLAEPKSNGFYPHTIATGEVDEDGDKIYKETGKVVLLAKTGIAFPDGSPKVVKIFNGRGAQISLAGKKIGNGSRGRIKTVMAIYQATKNMGITFYLDGVQLSKFVAYEGDSFESIEDEEEGEVFEGVGDVSALDNEVGSEAAGSNEAVAESDEPRL